MIFFVTFLIIPPPHRRCNGGILDSPWCLSARLSVDKISVTFWEKTISSINFISVVYSRWVSLMTSIHFRVSSVNFGPMVAKYLDENGFSRKKYIGLIHLIPGIHPYGVSLLTPFYFRVPYVHFGHLVARYWTEIFFKLLAQFIWYRVLPLMGCISWPLFIFVFLASLAALRWPNILPKMVMSD